MTGMARITVHEVGRDRTRHIPFDGSFEVVVDVDGHRIKFAVVDSEQKPHVVVTNGPDALDPQRAQWLHFVAEGKTDWRKE